MGGMRMPKKSLDGLTESMFYVLMAFCRMPMCGTDIAEFISAKTRGPRNALYHPREV